MYNVAKSVAQERTEKATVITKKRDFHHIKRRTMAVQRCFYIFDIMEMKKSLFVKQAIMVLKQQEHFSYK